MSNAVAEFITGQAPDPRTESLTLTEAADRLKICTATLRQWREHGKIKVCQLSPRVIRVRASEIERLLKESES